MTNAELYVMHRISQSPGIRQGDILGSDREGAERRRNALSSLLAQRLIVRSPKPYTYRLKTQEDRTQETTQQLVATKTERHDYNNPLECPGPLCAKFRAFHERRPDVYTESKIRARWAQQQGHTKYSMSAIMEYLRWERKVLSGSDPLLRVRYARMLAQEPEFRNLFNPKKKTTVKNC